MNRGRYVTMTARPAVALVIALLALLVPRYATARCDPAVEPDKSDIANARAAVAATCDCTGAANHDEYTRCSARVLRETLANKSCKGLAQPCAARSTCGKPGFVTCCITKPNGTRCKIAKDAAHCRAPKNGTACVGASTMCCDACAGSGCAATTTTAPPTTTTTFPRPGCETMGDFPSCGGPCGGSSVCQALRFVPSNGPATEECRCVLTGLFCSAINDFACQTGSCPAGEVCNLDFTTAQASCGCAPSSPSGAFVGEH